MAVKYLAGNRLYGTDAERLAMSSEWAKTGTKVVSNGSGTVTATIDTSGTTNQYITFDLGATLADTWVLRYKQNVTTNDIVMGSSQAGAIYVGLTDTTSIGGEHMGSGASTLYQRMRHISGNWYVDGFDIRVRDGSTTTGSSTSGAVLSRGAQTFYVEIVKNGASSTVKYFSGSDYSTGQIGSTLTVNGTGSGSSLQYLGINAYNDTISSGSLVVACSEFKIYDDQTTASSVTYDDFSEIQPSLPNGATFLTSDTNKLYMFDGTDTWNEVA